MHMIFPSSNFFDRCKFQEGGQSFCFSSEREREVLHLNKSNKSKNCLGTGVSGLFGISTF